MLQELQEHKPDFVAVHVQGVQNDSFANDLTAKLAESELLRQFETGVALFDVDKTVEC